MRSIFLPELISIAIKNYTLYPNGLDFHYNFVKGINLVLGGNGMGKTTFVNIIKFGLIGLYKKQRDYTRTYKDKAIVKRLLYPSDFFSARKNDNIKIDSTATVSLQFKLKDTHVLVKRSLDDGTLLYVSVNNEPLYGLITSEERYERMPEEMQSSYLLHKYEDTIVKYSNLYFDDLIFFVNEILFFGENHKTVLWNNGIDDRYDVQNELFNKYFNEPDLDIKRQEAQRQARYFDSLSRHKSEDMRVITNLINKIKKDQESTNDSFENSKVSIIDINNHLIELKEQLDNIHKSRTSVSQKISQLQGEINMASLKVSEYDKEKNVVERKLNTKLWEQMHPQYDLFLKNIQWNHVCPMCNHEDEKLVKKVECDVTHCFACDNEIHLSDDDELSNKYREVTNICNGLYQSIASKQKEIKILEEKLKCLDLEYKNIDLKNRAVQQQKRELEYQNSINGNPQKLQTLYDEYDAYSRDKEIYQKRSATFAEIEKQLSKQIEDEILRNVSNFSAIFAGFAKNFLGVDCYLTYTKYDGEIRRFFPVIDGKIRYSEDSLSESQRFFIDHSFRMSILTFFYNTPSFYIVETPDSSLDISYEKNAANVFLRFLNNPNAVIITSNLNNSSFVNHLIENQNTHFSMVGLFDIAKKSAIQGTSDQLKYIYNNIKKHAQL